MMKMRMQVFFVVKHTRERLELVRFTSLDFFFVDEYHVVKLSKVRLLMDWLVLAGAIKMADRMVREMTGL